MMRILITWATIFAWVYYCMNLGDKWERDDGYFNDVLLKTVIIGSLLIIPMCYFISLVLPSGEGW